MPSSPRSLLPALAAILACAFPVSLPAQTAAVTAAPAATVDTYVIDPVHSKAQFDISHLLFSTVTGKFPKFEGTIRVDTVNLANSSVEVTIDAASVTTDNERRDKDLRSPNFFDVAKYPTITFKSTSVKDLGDGGLQVGGMLSIHGKTEPVVIAVTGWRTGPGNKPGVMMAGFRKGTLAIKRSTFGMTYLMAVAGDEVDITLSVEASRVQPAS